MTRRTESYCGDCGCDCDASNVRNIEPAHHAINAVVVELDSGISVGIRGTMAAGIGPSGKLMNLAVVAVAAVIVLPNERVTTLFAWMTMEAPEQFSRDEQRLLLFLKNGRSSTEHRSCIDGWIIPEGIGSRNNPRTISIILPKAHLCRLLA